MQHSKNKKFADIKNFELEKFGACKFNYAGSMGSLSFHECSGTVTNGKNFELSKSSSQALQKTVIEVLKNLHLFVNVVR